MIAVNLCDLDLANERRAFSVVSLLLRDFISDDPLVVQVRSDRFDKDSILLNSRAAQDEERLNALVDLLQTVIGRRIRCGRREPKGGWREIKPQVKIARFLRFGFTIPAGCDIIATRRATWTNRRSRIG